MVGGLALRKSQNVSVAMPVEDATDTGIVERRRDPRIPQRHRTIQFSMRDETVDFSLQALSLRGASGSTPQPLRTGLAGAVLFEGGHSVPATVRWTRDRVSGLSFATPLPLDLLHAAPRKRHSAPAPRAPRYSVSRPATLICAGDRRFAVQICNISQGGMLIFGRPVLLPGHVVEIVCGAAPILRCQVRWVRNGFAGLQFAAPISLADFEEHSRA